MSRKLHLSEIVNEEIHLSENRLQALVDHSVVVTHSNYRSSSVEAQHIIGHFGDDVHRPDDKTNSVKALKETSWSSTSGLNPTRTTPPCYNNTTLGNCLYAQRQQQTTLVVVVLVHVL